MSIWLNPVTYLVIPLLVFAMGKGSAWYWCQIMHQSLSPQLTHFAIAFSAFFGACDILFEELKNYARSKTEGIEDGEKRHQAYDSLHSKLVALLYVIIASAGLLCLQMFGQ